MKYFLQASFSYFFILKIKINSMANILTKSLNATRTLVLIDFALATKKFHRKKILALQRENGSYLTHWSTLAVKKGVEQ